MSNVRVVEQYGDNLAILFDDGSRMLCLPTPTGMMWLPTASSIEGSWSWPLDLTVWTYIDEYGMRIHPITGVSAMHYGMDISGSGIGGTDIHAAGVGTVRYKGYSSGGYGNYIAIEHDDGSGTFYAHMQGTSLLSDGDRVDTSTVVGKVGTTGSSTGNHLHFNTQELYNPSANSGTIDPRTYMANRGVI